MIAVAPAFAISSTPSGNGKNASEAATVPFKGSCGLHRANLARIDPAHLPGTHAHRLAVPHIYDRVRLHVLADFPAQITRRAFLPAVGCRFVTTFKSASLSGRKSASCTSMPPETFFKAHLCRSGATSTRRKFFLAANFALAASSKPGAAITSRKSFAISSAVAPSIDPVHSDHATEC